MFMKNICPQGGCLPLPRGYIHEYGHIQISFFSETASFKANFMCNIVGRGNVGRGNESLYKWSRL